MIERLSISLRYLEFCCSVMSSWGLLSSKQQHDWAASETCLNEKNYKKNDHTHTQTLSLSLPPLSLFHTLIKKILNIWAYLMPSSNVREQVSVVYFLNSTYLQKVMILISKIATKVTFSCMHVFILTSYVKNYFC